ncbi:MAG TPA: putative porin [Pyrinomonadaceae bacterium]|nr:putative porin [Pyrinomonadaceae bacterium]
MRLNNLRALVLSALVLATSASAAAQTPNDSRSPEQPKPSVAAAPVQTASGKLRGSLFDLEDMRRQLSEQHSEIEELRAALKEQSRLIGELRTRVEHAEASSHASAPLVREAVYATGARDSASAHSAPAGAEGAAQDAKIEERVKRAEEQAKKTSDAVAKQLGSLTFSGDLRFRYESFYGQQNALASSDNPAALGNPLTTRQRLRMRARLAVRGKISDEFEWGLRLSTGSFADAVSTNQSLTDFFTRKPFTLDQAYFAYKPKQLPGFQIQAGRFETPWTRTELTWDNDISTEGLSESYTRAFKKSSVKNVSIIAWQLPLLERNAAFVLGADGRVDLSASGRAGRDLALYGAQLRTEIALTKNVSLRLSASDLYFSGTQFITPAQVFNGNVQFPVTFNIPASGTTPARTITTQVSIPRELLVAGNGNLGLSVANTNAVNRDGRLSSGYNLVDLIARADFTRSKRWPVMLLLNFVTNTQTHDVVTAGPDGANVLLPNHEGQGFWGEFQIGKDVQRLPVDRIARGDVTLNYTFLRIEKDAVLSPFNGSDFSQSTDMRVHRFIVAYALDPRVAVSLTGFFTSRSNGLLGAFAQTPPGSLDRRLTRLQFDTTLRF